ncbi:sensor histidine kinase [Petroclostridium xylanilyticum]|uniref:sensor histidine kinase n=1 Tax=Petroclostridium xylanilyticum TaxID=1792311 RepID=UPI000B97EA3C|nr:histidine kinase [Petroclostridium xylanilyticum]
MDRLNITLLKKLLNMFKSLNIRSQLIFTYIPISLVFILALGIGTFNIVSHTLREKSKTFISQTLNILSNDITKKLEEYEKVCSTIALDYDLYSLLSQKTTDFKNYSQYNTVKQKLYYFTYNVPDIKSVFIYPVNRLNIIRSDSNIIYYDLNYKDTGMFKSLITNYDKKIWTTEALAGSDPVKNNYIYLLSSIPSFYSVNGVIQLQIYEKSICKLYKDTYFGNESTIFIIDEQGSIVSHPDKNRISTKIVPMLLDNINKASGTFITKIDNKEYLVVYSAIDKTPWKIISTIPMRFIELEINRIFTTALIVIILSSIFIISISVLLSSKIAMPLEKLGNAMESLEKGDFNTKLDFDGSNEVGKISKRFNTMVAEIRKLMDDIREEEREKKEAYIHALQAQIKPHFLYNTLFSIKCLASIKKQAEIEEMLDSLISLLMASINKGGEFITINEEIKYIKKYIFIQSYKYRDKFKIIYDIDPEIKTYYTLKLLIQPIIENSILHGIENYCKDFVIKIIGRMEEDAVIFKIQDNGKGIKEDILKKMFQDKKDEYKNVFSGIGIKNVNERIKLYFGDNYGLYYVSGLKQGTEAVIRLPVIKEKEGVEKHV